MTFTIQELCETYGFLICSSFAFSVVLQIFIYGFFKAFSLVKI